MATISRPNVGTTDRDTLFHAVKGRWVEIVDVGFPITPCLLETLGVPERVAVPLVREEGGTGKC